MGLLDRLASAIRPTQIVTQPEVLTRAPNFAVTRFTSNNPFSSLIEYEENYFNQYILYTAKAIDYISNKVASQELHLYDQKGMEVPNHEIMQDLKLFNPYMNLWQARKLREMHLLLTGAAFWYIDREPEQGRRAEFYPLDPVQMQMMTNSAGLPSYWTYKDADGKIVQFPLEDIVYFYRVNPANWFEGLSPLKTMLYWTNAYAQGSQYNMNKLGNNANADKFIVFEGMGETEKDKLEDQLRNKYGGSRNAGRTGILTSKPEIVNVSEGQKDLDYVEGMKMLRQDILAAFGIPEALLFPSATKSNTKEAVTLFQSDTLEPLLAQELAALNEQLIPRYDNRLNIRRLYHFGVDNVVEADKDALVSQVEKLRKTGVFTRDQALIYIGQEPVGGDLGSQYMIEAADKLEETSKSLTEKAKAVGDQLDAIIKKQELEEFRAKNEKLAEDQEGIMYSASLGFFEGQLGRIANYIASANKVSLSKVFDMPLEVESAKQAFRESYLKVIANSNDVGNTEIKSALFKKNSPHFIDYKTKSISGEALMQLAKKLDYFAEEINETTLKKLRKVLATGIEEGFDKSGLINTVSGIFNEYIDGQKNIDVLSKLDLYVAHVTATDDGKVVVSSGNRYNAMLERITKSQANGDITKSQMDEALKALRGLIDPSDPIGKTVDDLLSAVYGVNKNKGISYSRAVTIARTESTYARNLGFDDMYSDNPFVTGKTWNSALDSSTRESHANVNNTSVGIKEAFSVGGSQMKFPGDTSLGAGAKEVANCRCRITAETI